MLQSRILLEVSLSNMKHIRETANVNLYHVNKLPFYLSFTVYHFSYTQIGTFASILFIRIGLSCFYLLISHFKNFSTWISRLVFVVKAMLNLSFLKYHKPWMIIFFLFFTSESLGKVFTWCYQVKDQLLTGFFFRETIPAWE